MTLSQRITDLAQALAQELKARTTSDHRGVARAWVNFSGIGAAVGMTGAPTMLASCNIAGVERLARGKYRVMFGTAMVDSNYCWQGQATHDSWWSGSKPETSRLQLVVKTPLFIQLNCRNAIGLPVDARELNLTVWR
jgi:hypothetical protein